MKPVPILQCLALVLLFAWRLMPEPYLEWLLLPLWVMSGWLIFASSLEAARLRRRAWLDQYLLVSSPWHTRWRGGWLMSLWHLVLAALLALFMLVKLLWLSPWLWVVLAVHLPLLWILGKLLRRRLQGHVKAPLLGPLMRRLLVPLGGLVLLIGYLLATLYISQPNMQGMSWTDAVVAYLPGSRSSLTLLATAERAHHLLELTVQWAMQNALGDVDNSGLLGLFAWSLLVVSGAAFIWAWLRLLTGIDSLFAGRTAMDSSGESV